MWRSWAEEEATLANVAAYVPWRGRLDEIDRGIADLRSQVVGPLEAADRLEAEQPTRLWDELALLTDADLDLSWLSSPRTIMRRFRQEAEDLR